MSTMALEWSELQQVFHASRDCPHGHDLRIQDSNIIRCARCSASAYLWNGITSSIYAHIGDKPRVHPDGSEKK